MERDLLSKAVMCLGCLKVRIAIQQLRCKSHLTDRGSPVEDKTRGLHVHAAEKSRM